MQLRKLLAPAAVALTLLGCSLLPPTQPWTIEVYNNDAVLPIRVRIQTENSTQDWLLAAQEIRVLLRTPGPRAGRLILLDAETCAVLGEASFEASPAILVVVDRAPTGSGPWRIDAGPDDPILTAPVLPPVPLCIT